MTTKIPSRIINSTGVTAGSYTNSSITVNEAGQITSASSGAVGGVSSVNSLTGSVILTTSNISEGTNLYYTDARARSSLSFSAGSGGYNSSTGVISIPTNTSDLTNGAGFLTSNQNITLSGDVSATGVTSLSVTLANSGVTAGTYTKLTVDSKGRATSGTTLSSGDLPTYTGTLTSSQVTDALGYTPYNSTNPSGYTTNTGTVTSVSGTGTVSGLTLTGTVTGSGSLTLGGTLSLTSSQVTTALGYTPYNSTNPSGYTTNTGTVTSVSGTGTVSGLTLTGTVTGSGSLTLGGTLSLTSSQVTDALGYTPYNSTNPSGYITSSGSISGSAGSLSNTSNYMIGRGSYAAANVDSTIDLGVWNQSNAGDSHTVLVFGQGGSTSTVQQRFHYTGSMEFRNRTDSSNWTGWKTVLTSSNYNSYSPTLTGGNASGTWSINITGNSATVGSLSVHSDRNNEANKIVRTDSNGYIQAGWINTTSGDQGTIAIDRVYASYDQYIRYYTPANFRTVLDVPTRTGGNASGTWSINITGNSATTSQTTFGDLYTNGWFRNNNSNQGLYNQTTTQHLSSNTNGYWDMSSTTSISSIRFYTGGHVTSLRGYVYADSSNNIGFLNSGGSWRARVVGDDYWLVDGSSARAQLYYDSNDTGYYSDQASTSRYNYFVPNKIKCVGNVNNEPRWDFSAYVVEAQHWYGNNSSQTMYMGESGNTYQIPGSGGIRPTIMYDYNDTGYYCDPNSTSALSTVQAYRFGTNQGSQSPDNSHPGYGMRPFYSWNIGQANNASSGYSNGITVGSNPSDQAYGFQIVQNMWDDATYTRRYNSGWQGWRKLAWMNDWFGSSLIHEDGRHYATILYDSNDTGYYCDPNGTNRLNFVNSNNHYIQPGYMLYSDHGSWQGEYNKIQWHSSHLYLQNNGGGYLLILRRGDGGERFWCDYNGNVTASGNITAYSDQRLKTNIETIANPLELVNKLRGVTFDWIETGKHSYGLIAQEVEQVIPELVLETTNGNTETDVSTTVKSVDYSKLVSVLIEAVKEQQQQIDKLTKLVEVLLAK